MPSWGADPDRTHLLEAGLHLPFSFCLRTHLQRSVQVAIGSQLILEGRDSSEIPQLVCVWRGLQCGEPVLPRFGEEVLKPVFGPSGVLFSAVPG